MALTLRFATITEREPEFYDDDTNLGNAVLRSQSLAREVNDWPRHMEMLGRSHLPFDALQNKSQQDSARTSRPATRSCGGATGPGPGTAGSSRRASIDSPPPTLGPTKPMAMSAAEAAEAKARSHLIHAVMEVQTLNLMSRGLGSTERPGLIGLISTNTALRSLNLLHNRFSVEEAEELAHLARGRLVSVCGVAEGQDDITIAQGRDGRKLEPPDAIFLASDLLTQPIKKLRVSEHTLGPTGGVAIANSLRVTTEGLHTKLQSLDISLCSLGQVCAVGAPPARHQWHNKKPLIHLPGAIPASLSQVGSEAIARALTAKWPTLTELNMAFNRMGPSGGAAFARMLARNCSLTELNLHYNSLGDAGVEGMADAIMGNRGSRLARLTLSSNELTGKGITSLMSAAVAVKGRRLQMLDVRWNTLGHDGSEAVEIAREMNPKITIATDSQDVPSSNLSLDADHVLHGLSQGLASLQMSLSPRTAPKPSMPYSSPVKNTASSSRGHRSPRSPAKEPSR